MSTQTVPAAQFEKSGPYPGLYPAANLEESIRLSLLVAAGRIPWPTSYVEVVP
jgi:hypothetical protein